MASLALHGEAGPAVTVVDYGVGNVRAFAHIFRCQNITVHLASTPEALAGARRLILPGVGAFDRAMARFNASGLRDAVERLVHLDQVPVLGVCVGFQMMARRSEEGALPGLGWLNADVVRFDERLFDVATRLPHMGWNDVTPRAGERLFEGLVDPRFYFLHSYYVVPDHDDQVLASTTYGRRFAAAVGHGPCRGTQFHPEKSHQWGIDLLANFAR